mmetsp:Transcript_2726/g.4140  ORF Transcript_2726/g.4140 Transcript_2726/m.4140 type:complete len:233 (-) Transcript_2726:343-1041(-)
MMPPLFFFGPLLRLLFCGEPQLRFFPGQVRSCQFLSSSLTFPLESRLLLSQGPQSGFLLGLLPFELFRRCLRAARLLLNCHAHCLRLRGPQQGRRLSCQLAQGLACFLLVHRDFFLQLPQPLGFSAGQASGLCRCCRCLLLCHFGLLGLSPLQLGIDDGSEPCLLLCQGLLNGLLDGMVSGCPGLAFHLSLTLKAVILHDRTVNNVAGHVFDEDGRALHCRIDQALSGHGSW